MSPPLTKKQVALSGNSLVLGQVLRPLVNENVDVSSADLSMLLLLLGHQRRTGKGNLVSVRFPERRSSISDFNRAAGLHGEKIGKILDVK